MIFHYTPTNLDTPIVHPYKLEFDIPNLSKVSYTSDVRYIPLLLGDLNSTMKTLAFSLLKKRVLIAPTGDVVGVHKGCEPKRRQQMVSLIQSYVQSVHEEASSHTNILTNKEDKNEDNKSDLPVGSHHPINTSCSLLYKSITEQITQESKEITGTRTLMEYLYTDT